MNVRPRGEFYTLSLPLGMYDSPSVCPINRRDAIMSNGRFIPDVRLKRLDLGLYGILTYAVKKQRLGTPPP